ncbi:unnamed protein product [Diamesa hyperborea]
MVVILVVSVIVINYKRKRARLVKLIDKIPGPPALPLIGEYLLRIFNSIFKIQGISKAWIGTKPYVLVSKPSAVEPILSSPKHIDKSSDYDYLRPWLGTGLLTSFGSKWHSRRKILTPAFHFKILEDFMDIFNEQSAIMVKKMAKEVNKDSFNIFPYVTLCTLDIVCETAMGRDINAQGDSESDYVKAVYQIGEIVLNRQAKFWLQPDLIFKFTKDYAKHENCIKILHGFSNRVILIDDEESFGKKKRLAFLDLLITASGNGTVLTDEDIREEVDTFMFEGHDTTSAAVSWTLFLLGGHPDIQEKVFQEIDGILGGDRERAPTMKELGEMKYLECCIKEGLRLYPSVPLIARHLNEDVYIPGEDNKAGYIVPAGTTAMIVTYMLHRNPDVYAHPERYDPNRFLPENSHGRHPYAYIPFSAGPRNCIGQKFAILEEKAVISSVIRKYKIEAIDRREDLTLLGELILRPKDGLAVRITQRD